MKDYIYLSPPHVGDVERRLLLEAFDTNWVAPVGPDLQAFENEITQLTKIGHAVALSSGTAALHLALQVIGVGRGDTVLVPSFTFAATANAVCYLGAEPIFVDSSADTWNIDPDLTAEELDRCARQGRVPKAVVAVDMYGQCADYDELLKTCAEYGVALVEDAAEALGSSYRGRPAGTFGVAGVLSFNGNKIITTGGGGMLLTDDIAFADQVRYLATQAREPVPHYEHRAVGYNYRLSNLLAAVGRGQLTRLNQRVNARRETASFYRQSLAGLPGIDFMPIAGYGVPNCWLTCILVDREAFGGSREDIRLHLAREGIETRPTWKPMHLQPVYRDHRVCGGSISEEIFRRGLCLPSGSSLTDHDRHRIVDAIRSVPGRLSPSNVKRR
jgi:dTDP-4-amino-4,6-dideoxygalactose transaminase